MEKSKQVKFKGLDHISPSELKDALRAGWSTTTSNPLGRVRTDAVVTLMSQCAGILLEVLKERDSDIKRELDGDFDQGGDDTVYDYTPCALENICNVCNLYINTATGEGGEISPKDYPYIAGSDMSIMDDDAFTKEQLEIYREYTQQAGGSWDQYDEIQSGL